MTLSINNDSQKLQALECWYQSRGLPFPTRSTTLRDKQNFSPSADVALEIDSISVSKCLIVYIGKMNSEEALLLGKMTAAIHLAASDYLEIDISSENGLKALDSIKNSNQSWSESIGIIMGADALKSILDLGSTAKGNVAFSVDSRGTWTTSSTLPGIPLMPTWHPSELLSDPGLKRNAWNDLQAVSKKIGPE